MGKIKGKKNGASRNNPILLDSVASLTEAEEEMGDKSPRDIFIDNMLEQMQSHIAEERDSGLNSLSVAAQDEGFLIKILAQDGVKVAGQLLVDKSPMVRHSAAGALRNMSASGPTICEHMISQDVLTPLVSLFKQEYCKSWTPKAQMEDKIDTHTETFIESVNLLWNLCENSRTGVNVFNREGLLGFLASHLDFDTYGIRVVFPVAECLITVTEDNDKGLKIETDLTARLDGILSRQIESIELPQKERDFLFFQTQCLGIMINLNKGNISTFTPDRLGASISILSNILDFDYMKDVNKFSSEVPLSPPSPISKRKESKTNGVSKESNHKEKAKLEMEVEDSGHESLVNSFERLSRALSATSLALQIISNGIFCEEDGEEESESESGEDPEYLNDDEMNMETFESDTNQELQQAIVDGNFSEKIWAKLQVPPVNVTEILKENEYGMKILATLTQLRGTSLLCLQNLISVLNFEQLGGFENTKKLWDSLGNLLISEDRDIDLIEASSSALRAIMQKWIDFKCDDYVKSMSPSEFNVFLEVYEGVQVPKIQANVVKIIGGLGVSIFRFGVNSKGDAAPLLSEVAKFLITSLAGPLDKEHLWVKAEILDTLFDVFSDDEFNHVLTQLRLIEKLKNFQTQYKKACQMHRKEFGEHKAVIVTSKSNLPRFIEYKMKHGCV